MPPLFLNTSSEYSLNHQALRRCWTSSNHRSPLSALLIAIPLWRQYEDSRRALASPSVNVNWYGEYHHRTPSMATSFYPILPIPPTFHAVIWTLLILCRCDVEMQETCNTLIEYGILVVPGTQLSIQIFTPFHHVQHTPLGKLNLPSSPAASRSPSTESMSSVHNGSSKLNDDRSSLIVVAYGQFWGNVCEQLRPLDCCNIPCIDILVIR